MAEQTAPAWRPSPQPACEPGCTCHGSFISENDRLAAYVLAEHGRPRLIEPRASGGGDRLPSVQEYWDRDPAPVEEPEPVESRIERLPAGVAFAPLPDADDKERVSTPVHLSFIDRIRNATNRKAK